jgi:hypothetical protein
MSRWGSRKARLVAEMEAKWGNDAGVLEKLPPEERKALDKAVVCIQSEGLRLMDAGEQLGIRGANSSGTSVTPQVLADYLSCYLRGALDLDSAQFPSVDSLLQQYCQQAAQERLLQTTPGETDDAASRRIAALELLNEDARRDIQPLLSEGQAAMLSHAFTELKLITTTVFPAFEFKVQQD